MSLMSLTTTQMLVTYDDISTQVHLVFCLAAGSTAESLRGGKISPSPSDFLLDRLKRPVSSSHLVDFSGLEIVGNICDDVTTRVDNV